LEKYRDGIRPTEPWEVSDVIKITDIYDEDHKSVAEVRDSDYYVNISSFFDWVSGEKMNYKDYNDAIGTRAFTHSFTCARNFTLIDVPPFNSYGSYWAHRKTALHAADYCGLQIDLEHLLRHIHSRLLDAGKY
jgi:hypothetical protein